jgi:hypothetical protein
MMGADQERYAQVVPAMGGAILAGQGNPTRGVPTPRNKWRDFPTAWNIEQLSSIPSLSFFFLYFFGLFLSPFI